MKKPRKTEEPGPDLFGAAPAAAPSPGSGGQAAPAQKPAKRPLAFSYSKLSLYEECPLKYRFKYIDKLKEEPKTYFSFGRSIHNALEFMYAVKAPPFPAVAEVLEAFKKDWGLKSYLEKGYRDPARADMDCQKGLEMLRAYCRHNEGRLRLPFRLEYSTDVEVDGLLVRIIADKIEYLGKGELLLVDYKTGKDARRQPDQLHMYQKICELDPRLRALVRETYGEDPQALRVRSMQYYHVPSNKEYSFDRAEDGEISVFWERVLGVAGDIRAEKYDPTPGERACAWCDYKKLCPHHGGGEADSVPAPAAQPAGESAGGLADRYGRLLEKLDALSAEAEELKARIISLADGAGLLSGNEYELDIKRSERTEFRDREAVIAALNEFGLYQKALGLTVTNITALLNDPSVPEAAREKLRGLAVKSRAFEVKTRKIK